MFKWQKGILIALMMVLSGCSVKPSQSLDIEKSNKPKLIVGTTSKDSREFISCIDSKLANNENVRSHKKKSYQIKNGKTDKYSIISQKGYSYLLSVNCSKIQQTVMNFFYFPQQKENKILEPILACLSAVNSVNLKTYPIESVIRDMPNKFTALR